MPFLQEFCSSRGVALRIDREAGLLRGVKLLGLASKNGREYPEATLARAAALYEGAKVNVNHPKGHPLAPRDYQDRLGTIRNVVSRPGEGLFGDLQYNPKHALAEQLLWDAEHAPENVGFSHNVQARTAKRGETTIVEEILAVQSVDLVADPATTRGLFESTTVTTQSNRDDDVSVGEGEHGKVGESPVTATQKSPPLLVSLSPPRFPPGPTQESPLEQDTEIEHLRNELTRLQAAQAIAHKRAAIAALLVEHNLPPLDEAGPAPPDMDRHKCEDRTSALLSDDFLESLVAAPDEPAIRKLIQQRAMLVEQAYRWKQDINAKRTSRYEPHLEASRPRSREQMLTEPHHENTLDAFVKAIRR
jgi:hypothetical protein